jgi:hypothetical protein
MRHIQLNADMAVSRRSFLSETDSMFTRTQSGGRAVPTEEFSMIRKICVVAVCAIALSMVASETQAQERGFGASWGVRQSSQNLSRFYHYPYVTYPQNYWGNEYYRSADNMYHRYPPEMRIPVYNKAWHNYYPSPRRYHWGHHFITDVF